MTMSIRNKNIAKKLAIGKVSVSCGFISLTMGNSGLPLGHGLPGNIQAGRQLFLGQVFFFLKYCIFSEKLIYSSCTLNLIGLFYSCPEATATNFMFPFTFLTLLLVAPFILQGKNINSQKNTENNRRVRYL